MTRPRQLITITMLAGLALLPACLTAGFGACGSEERAFFNAIEQFDALPIEAEDHPYGICGAIFTTHGPVDAVVDHYVAQFERTDWTVTGPVLEDGGGEPGVTGVTTVSAYRDTFQYHVAIFEMVGGSVDVNVTAGDAGQ